MLPEYFQSAWRVRDLRAGPAGPLVTSFADQLRRDGYAELTARRHLRSAEHVAYWASRIGVGLDGPIEAILDGFDRHLRGRRQCTAPAGRPFGHTFRVQILGGARLFLHHLSDAGLVSAQRDDRIMSGPPLFVQFCQWMQQQRGTCQSTLANYGIHICELLTRVGDDPTRWDARGLREFGRGRCRTRPRLLRSRVRGGSARPRHSAPARAFGIARGRHRTAQLRDIDWKRAWIHVSGKGRRETRLPLTHELGDALVTYLTRGRPQADTDVVFVRSRPPFRPFRSHCAVSVIVDRAFARAGVTRPSRGAAH
jgi:integrase/recombinase XerD